MAAHRGDGQLKGRAQKGLRCGVQHELELRHCGGILRCAGTLGAAHYCTQQSPQRSQSNPMLHRKEKEALEKSEIAVEENVDSFSL